MAFKCIIATHKGGHNLSGTVRRRIDRRIAGFLLDGRGESWTTSKLTFAAIEATDAKSESAWRPNIRLFSIRRRRCRTMTIDVTIPTIGSCGRKGEGCCC
jgi:hypothetical protein